MSDLEPLPKIALSVRVCLFERLMKQRARVEVRQYLSTEKLIEFELACCCAKRCDEAVDCDGRCWTRSTSCRVESC